MKKLTLFAAILFIAASLMAQTPQAFKYQAVARNGNGNLIQNQLVAFRIGILHGGPVDSLVYRERHTLSTNDYGLADLEIGKGTVLVGSFSNIDWSAGQMFMKVELDPSGGSNFINMGTIELLSVPYAKYADSSGGSAWEKLGNDIRYDAGSVSIGNGQPSPSAILELNSTDKGFLLPRMTTTEIEEITKPEDGMMIYNKTNKRLYMFNDSLLGWLPLPIGSLYAIWPSCGFFFIDFRDGEFYSTVNIGDQCWMRGNLKYGTMIPNTTTASDNGIVEKYCYLNDPANCDEYGGLYHWNEIMKWSEPGDICPYGWRVATDDDWCILATFLDPTADCSSIETNTGTDAGGKLKETEFSHWWSPNTGATNASGFTALPGGSKSGVGAFLSLGTVGNFWTSSYYGEVGGYSTFLFWQMNHNSQEIRRDKDYPAYGLSVRCIKGPKEN